MEASKAPASLSIATATEPAPGTNWRECPNCYETYDYSRDGDKDRLPRLLNCGHLVCSSCAGELWLDCALCCPTCLEMSACNSAEDLPVPVASPVGSPTAASLSPHSARAPVDEGESPGTPSSSPGGSQQNKLSSFLSAGGGGSGSSPRAADACSGSTVAGVDAVAAAASAAHSRQLKCIVEQCAARRTAGKYFCEHHAEKGRRVTWKTTERLVQRYEGVSHYRLNTGGVEQGGRLAEELGPEPSLDTLHPVKLAEAFRAQEKVAMGGAMWLIDQGIRALAREPNVLRLDAPVRVVGDLHGQFFDLLSMVEMCGLPREGEPGGFLFLGDYVDRGAYSCEVMLYLLSLKLAYPKHVHLLRGNHECRSLTGHFGFKAECKAKYGLPVYYRFLRLFEELPLCAVVTSDVGRYLCAHGGLSPDLASIEEVDALQRRGEPPMSGPLCDILWADPADDPGCCPPPGRMTTAELGALLGAQFAPNRLRGCSVSFGYAAAVEFLERNDLLCLIRAHAVQEGGYYRHFEDAHQRHRQQCSTAETGGAADAAAAAEGEEAAAAAPPLSEAVLRSRSLPAVITVFSAPNYCGRYGNKGAILTLERGSVEPAVRQYDCVPSPAPKAGADAAGSDILLTALIEACPYMPSTFRDFVLTAVRMGPAQQPLGAKSEAAAAAAEACHANRGAVAERRRALQERVARAETRGAAAAAGTFPAAVGAAGAGDGSGAMTTHALYQTMAANDRINERHPEALFEGAEPKKLNRNGSMHELQRKLSNVQAITRRFEQQQEEGGSSGGSGAKPDATPASPATAAAERPSRVTFGAATSSPGSRGPGRPAHTVPGRATRMFFTSGGIPSGSGGGSGGSGSTAAPPAAPPSPTDEPAQFKEEKGGCAEVPPTPPLSPLPQPPEEVAAAAAIAAPPPPAQESTAAAPAVASAAALTSQQLECSDEGAVAAAAALRVGTSSEAAAAGGGGGGGARGHSRTYTPLEACSHNKKYVASMQKSNNAAKATRSALFSVLPPALSPTTSAAAAAAASENRKSLAHNWRQRQAGAEAALSSSQDDGTPDAQQHERRHSDGTCQQQQSDGSDVSNSGRGGTRPEREEDLFSEREMQGLKLLFALMDYNDTQYIDADALQQYAGEHDDFAQAREVEACIEAVDVDGDNRIGLMDFMCFALRLKNAYDISLAQGRQERLNREVAEKVKLQMDGGE